MPISIVRWRITYSIYIISATVFDRNFISLEAILTIVFPADLYNRVINEKQNFLCKFQD